MPVPFVYLASDSPRRRELLAQIGVTHEVFSLTAPGTGGGVDETPRPQEPPVDYVKRIARIKAALGWRRLRDRRLPPYPLLAADTAVVVEGKIFGKPGSPRAAEDMLAALSGRTHEVYSAVALAYEQKIDLALSRSKVTFRLLTGDEIADYVITREPLDKAGAYAIQGRAAIFVERIEGSYSGVMGLPLFETAQLLARAGMELL
jgi:septum formation protein